MNNEMTQDLVSKLIDSINLLLRAQLKSGEVQHQEDTENSSNHNGSKLNLAGMMLNQIKMQSEVGKIQERLEQVESKIEELMNNKNSNKIDQDSINEFLKSIKNFDSN